VRLPDQVKELIQVKSLLPVFLLFPTMLLAQSPFDGTWVAKLDSVQFPPNPEIYSLQNGTYECASCVPKINVKADGKDYPVAGSPYFSTVAVQVMDNNSIQITEKQRDKTVYVETDTVSADGGTLTEKIADLAGPNGQPVNGEETYKRVSPGPAGASPISGSWQAESLKDISESGITVTYQSTADGLKVSNPTGEGYSAKFDGKEYPVQGAPAHNTVSLKRVKANTIIETDKLDGRAHYILRMTVLPDGKTMRVTETDMERGTKTVYIMEKKSQ
jgi:hypothetical protein